MKLLFAIFLLLHGAIHVMGFLKAFHLSEIKQLPQTISKPIGLLWITATILFLITSFLFFIRKESWPLFAIISVLISQIVIMLFWQHAKFGSIVNAIVLLVAIQGFAEERFVKMTHLESTQLLQNIESKSPEVITEAQVLSLPPIIQQWMRYSGVIGKPKVVSVRLRQKGEMRTQPDQDWIPFTAEQYIDVENPAFVWAADVKKMPLISFRGRDKLQNGAGGMLIKVASLIPVVNASSNEKINSGAMLRFLGEMCWYPSAACSEYIHWEPLDENSVKATFTVNETSVSGIFTFSEEGKFISFEADRFYGANDSATLEKWFIEPLEFKIFQGVKIPAKCRVIWKLKEKDFNWLTLEICALDYNMFELYETERP